MNSEKNCKIINLFILIFFYLVASVIIVISIKNKEFHPYTFTSYLLTYDKGFISRGIIGTVYSFLFNDDNLINGFIYTNIIFNIILCGWFLFNITKLIKNNNENLLLSLSFCSFPIFYFWIPKFFGRIEIFWYLGFVFILWCFKDLTTLKTFMIFILSAICILIHHGFLFLIAPFVCILFLEQNKKKEFLLYGFFMIFIFLICQFMGKVDYNIMYNYVFNRINNSNIKLYYTSEYSRNEADIMLQYEFKIPIWEHIKVLKQGIVVISILAISILLTHIINISAIRKILSSFYSINKKVLFYFVMVISSLVVLCGLTIDWNRWVILFILSLQFFTIFKLNTTNVDLKCKFNNNSDTYILPILNIILLVALAAFHFRFMFYY